MGVSLFFYSNFCQNCKQIMKEVKKTNLTIKYICIDSQSVRSKLPKYINSVPSLVVGETDQIFVGNQILGWLNILKASKNKLKNMDNENNHKYKEPNTNNPPAVVNTPMVEGPSAWHTSEMNAFSDSYSFLDCDTSTSGDGGLSMIHNFEAIGEEKPGMNNGSFGLPGGAPSKSSMPVQYGNPVTGDKTGTFGSMQSFQKNSLDKQMEEMMSKRDLDVPMMPQRY